MCGDKCNCTRRDTENIAIMKYSAMKKFKSWFEPHMNIKNTEIIFFERFLSNLIESMIVKNYFLLI